VIPTASFARQQQTAESIIFAPIEQFMPTPEIRSKMSTPIDYHNIAFITPAKDITIMAAA
jgi:tRNA threonylcarbamoyladenosine modification (KEOPS) complex  Pcc1 subunit